MKRDRGELLAHSTKGDFFHGTRAEVNDLMDGDGAGYISR